MATIAEIGRHLDLTSSRVEKLAAEGIIPRAGSLDAIRVAYIRHLRKRKGGITDERARFDAARASLTELQVKERTGELVPAVDQDRVVISLATNTSARLQALPARLAPSLAAEHSIAACDRIVADGIAEALIDLSEEGQEALERLGGHSPRSAA